MQTLPTTIERAANAANLHGFDARAAKTEALIEAIITRLRAEAHDIDAKARLSAIRQWRNYKLNTNGQVVKVADGKVYGESVKNFIGGLNFHCDCPAHEYQSMTVFSPLNHRGFVPYHLCICKHQPIFRLLSGQSVSAVDENDEPFSVRLTPAEVAAAQRGEAGEREDISDPFITDNAQCSHCLRWGAAEQMHSYSNRNLCPVCAGEYAPADYSDEAEPIDAGGEA